MFQKIEAWMKKKQEDANQKAELEKAKKYYHFLKAGAAFAKFIQEDIKRQENGMNRHQRRRFEAELNEKGVFSPELIQYYQAKTDWIISEIDKRLNPPKPPKSTPGMQIRQTPPPGMEKPKSVA